MKDDGVYSFLTPHLVTSHGYLKIGLGETVYIREIVKCYKSHPFLLGEPMVNNYKHMTALKPPPFFLNLK